ncbi:MAG: hypothetical protein WDN46_00160 [Methylocella sp.]
MSLAPRKKPARRDVVIVTTPPAADAAVQAAAPSPPSVAAYDVISAVQALGFAVKPLFPDASVHAPMIAAATAPAAQNPELAAIEREQRRYYVAHVETDAQAQQIVEQLTSAPGVSNVYVKPAVGCPLAPPCAKPTAPAVVPDYSVQQGYLDAAPAGIGARNFAWTLPDGKGDNVRFIDIEGGWTVDHVELRGTGCLIGGQPFTDADWTNHGTAALGVLRAADNSFGVMGIAPEASFNAISHQGLGSAGAIDLASCSLQAGDITLLEMHRPGPRFGLQSRDDQQGYIAVEWWPDDFLAVRRAVLRGVIVVEAAGNGAQDLDDFLHDTPDPSFPETWANSFKGAAPVKVRNLLRASGSPQTTSLAGGIGQRIGNRPDLAAPIPAITPSV